MVQRSGRPGGGLHGTDAIGRTREVDRQRRAHRREQVPGHGLGIDVVLVAADGHRHLGDHGAVRERVASLEIPSQRTAADREDDVVQRDAERLAHRVHVGAGQRAEHEPAAGGERPVERTGGRLERSHRGRPLAREGEPGEPRYGPCDVDHDARGAQRCRRHRERGPGRARERGVSVVAGVDGRCPGVTLGHRARGRRSPTRIRRRTPRRCTRGGSSGAGRRRRRGGHRGARAPRGGGSDRAAVRRSRRRGDPAGVRRRADRRSRGAGARRRRARACPPTAAGRGVPASRRSGGGTVRASRGALPTRRRSCSVPSAVPASASNTASTPTFMCHSGVSAATKPLSVRLRRWTARGRSVDDMGGILT